MVIHNVTTDFWPLVYVKKVWSNTILACLIGGATLIVLSSVAQSAGYATS